MPLKKVIPEKPIFLELSHFFRQEICFLGIPFLEAFVTKVSLHISNQRKIIADFFMHILTYS
jgi:hypothetical protein